VGFNPFFVRSTLPTVKTPEGEENIVFSFNPFFVRSTLPTEWDMGTPPAFHNSFNPFFVRSTLPTEKRAWLNSWIGGEFQSLLRQVNSSNQASYSWLEELERISFNPFFVRSTLPTGENPQGPLLACQPFQSLLRQVNSSNSGLKRPLAGENKPFQSLLRQVNSSNGEPWGVSF